MSGYTFLVGDENPRFLEKSEEILRGAGYRMVPFSDGMEGKRLLADRGFTGMIAHVALPRFDGAQLCRFIKEEHDPSMPVILMSSGGEQETEAAEAAEADNVLVRPIKSAELLFAVRTLIRFRQLLRQPTPKLLRSEEVGRAGDCEPCEPGTEGAFQFDFFKAFLTVEVKRARRYGFPLSLMLVALDDMEEVKRQHGARVLTRLLEGVARVIRRTVRDIDIPVTLRDETIMVLMPHTDSEGARAVAERVRERILRSVYREDDLVIHPTISIGETTYDKQTDKSFSHVVRRASEAMEQAAQQGGDCVVWL